MGTLVDEDALAAGLEQVLHPSPQPQLLAAFFWGMLRMLIRTITMATT